MIVIFDSHYTIPVEDTIPGVVREKEDLRRRQANRIEIGRSEINGRSP